MSGCAYFRFRREISSVMSGMTLLVAAMASLPAAASTFTSMVIFGDSLSDTGNDFLALGGQTTPQNAITGNTYIPSAPYAPGVTFSNGPVWASYAAQALGVSAGPSLLGGTNYAYGGATTGGSGPIPNLLVQANQYLSSTHNVASPNALYVVEGGGNDARAALTAIQGASSLLQVQQIIQSAASSFATNVATVVSELKRDGAQHIVVWDTPNVGLAPAVAAGGLPASVTGSTVAFDMNLALAAALHGDRDVSIFDIYGLGTSIALNPSKYGFTNVTDACGAVAGANCSTYAYWDGIHPTTAADAVIARSFVADAVPEPATWAMMILGFAGVGFMTYRRKSKPTLITA